MDFFASLRLCGRILFILVNYLDIRHGLLGLDVQLVVEYKPHVIRKQFLPRRLLTRGFQIARIKLDLIRSRKTVSPTG